MAEWLLIHGAWQGAWAFDAWRPALARRGIVAHAIDLPGNGCDPADRTRPGDVSLDLYVRHAARVLTASHGPMIVVGHSGGGIVASQLAEAYPERVSALVHLAGMMLPSGVPFREIVAQCQRESPDADLAGIGPQLAWSADGLTSTVPRDAALQIFLHDCDPAAAAIAASKLTPQPERGRAIAPTLTAERHGRVPRVYVEARFDRSLHLPVQRRMQALSPGALRVSIDSGHVPQLAQPDVLTDRLCHALDGL